MGVLPDRVLHGKPVAAAVDTPPAEEFQGEPGVTGTVKP